MRIDRWFARFWLVATLLGPTFVGGCGSTTVGPEEPYDAAEQETSEGGPAFDSGGDAGGRDATLPTDAGDAGDARAHDASPGADASVDAGPPACVPGVGCLPSDAGCTSGGSTMCTDAGSVCLSTGQSASPGTSCGTNAVCNGDAVCVPCTANTDCTPAGTCTAWKTSCATGEQACVETDESVADNSACDGGACKAGACLPVICETGLACTAGCFTGTSTCPGGPTSPQGCSATSTPLEAGTGCDAGAVCTGTGACAACENDAGCTPATCELGQWNCSDYQCVTTGPAPAGSSCGTNKACDGQGHCNCTSGGTCTVSGSCFQGTTSCASGTAECVPSATPVSDGTSCGTNQYCYGGTCTPCTNGASCNPNAGSCQLGTINCMAAGAPSCVSNATAQANGTSCGMDMVCNGGQCVDCTAGGSCTSQSVDPCSLGTYSCATGSQQCVSGGADPNKVGAACGASSAGTCTNGRCVCPAGEAFSDGDCQSCTSFTGTTVYVDADPNVGVDNVCCGRFQASGMMFGGPCATIGQAILNASTGWSVSVQGNSAGNLSPLELYPIQVEKGLKISSSGTVCVPGMSGQTVVEFADNTSASFNGFTIGTSCQSTASGASVGVYFGTGTSGTLSPTTIQQTTLGMYVGASASVTLGSSTIQNVTTGVQIQGGYFAFEQSTIQNGQVGIQIDSGTCAIYSNSYVQKMSDTGVLCRSSTTPNVSSILQPVTDYGAALHILQAANYDLRASLGCSINSGSQGGYLQLFLGQQSAPSCPNPKQDAYGLYVEGNASVAPELLTVECESNDGVSLRTNSAFSTNTPTVTIPNSSLIESSGCNGIYAETGTVSAIGTTISHNHWGVVQRSALGSSSPTQSIVNLNGASGQTVYRNIFSCNSSNEPGACCTNSSCPPGYSIWNNSGLVLQADNDEFDSTPVGLCSCDSNQQNCVCSGATVGDTTPPDGTSIVNSPVSGGAGPGTTTKTNAAFSACP
jgi:hypothetical protein